MSISKIELGLERIEILETFQNKYNLKFDDISLLNQAFVHTSYTNENELDVLLSYEKLEFLGDAVLKLAVSEFLYQNFQNYHEGELTKLRGEIVSDKNIFRYAQQLDFENLIILGKNEKKQGGAKKESILACAFEALLGAIFINYKENGYKKAKNFLKENFLEDILNFNKNITMLNPKAILQEYTQEINHELPIYNLVKEIGKAHKKEFFIEVAFQNKIIGKGSGTSIKRAEVASAINAIENLGITKR